MIELISSLGFPIFTCLWFMYRLEPIIKNNTQAIIQMYSVVKECKKK